MSDALETYVLLAKQASGKALETLILQAIASPQTFSFTALLETPAVQALAQSEYANVVTLLRIFSYGTYQDYIQNRQTLPAIDNVATKKLKQLTLVTMAGTSHHLDYDTLKQALNCSTTRELEDLIIAATYASLIKAKMNTRSASVYVESTFGRDLDPARGLDSILSSLDAWSQTCDSVLTRLAQEIEATKAQAQHRKVESAAHDRALQEAKTRHAVSAQGRGKRGSEARDLGMQDDIMSDIHDDQPFPSRPQDVSGLTSMSRKRKVLTQRLS